MKRILEAKKKYEEIEIPSELKEIVSSAIEKSTPKKRGPLFYTKVLAPIALCAAICIAIGISGIGEVSPIENDAEAEMVSDTTATAEMAKSARMMPMADVCYPTAGTERMNEAMAENDASVIYSDENYISISFIDEYGSMKYLNFTQIDGADITLEDLGIEGYAPETPFYISSYDTVVVLIDGTEKEIKISRS